jgi:putative thiamine transport system permease protein
VYGLALIAVQIPYSAAYAYLILAPAEKRFEQRLVTAMQSYGYGFWPSWWLIKRPLLQQPLLLAWVFAALVSMAQYLPIILMGGGRWPTLTSELVAISSGANSQLLAIYAVSQWLLALLFLMIVAWPQRSIEGEQQ